VKWGKKCTLGDSMLKRIRERGGLGRTGRLSLRHRRILVGCRVPEENVDRLFPLPGAGRVAVKSTYFRQKRPGSLKGLDFKRPVQGSKKS